jgi:hypothetical protein
MDGIYPENIRREPRTDRAGNLSERQHGVDGITGVGVSTND